MMRRRVVVVSGGGTGIGRATALRFAKDGEAVAILGRRIAMLEQAADEICVRVPRAVVRPRACDVTDPESISDFVAWLGAEFGPHVDVLVNNAGVRADLHASDADLGSLRDDAHAVLAVNLVGAMLVTHALLPALRRPGGRVVYVSSVASYRGGKDIYAASKAGLVGLAYSQAQRLGPEGITVNVVAPGFIPDTEMFAGRLTAGRRAAEAESAAVKRVGTPSEVAHAIAYVASRDAGFVTGEVHHVNGGSTFGR